MKTIGITTEYIKLDALLKFAALVSSGGEAKSEYTYEHDYIVHKVSLAASGYEGLY